MSERRVDLHLHTTASDGLLSPAEVVMRAAKLGLAVIAITDHDTIAGVGAAMAAAEAVGGIEVIPGVEINTDVPHGEVHILGYFIDREDAELARRLEHLRASRVARARGMVAKLAALGIAISFERVSELAAGGTIGRPHVAQAIVEAGYVSSPTEAFAHYIGRDGPAYVEREKILPEDAVGLVARASGLPVLAHPSDIANLEDLLPRLVESGLVGLEAYYSGYSADTTDYLLGLARKHDLIATGGSDYHGGAKASFDAELGIVAVPYAAAEQLFALHRQRQSTKLAAAEQ